MSGNVLENQLNLFYYNNAIQINVFVLNLPVKARRQISFVY